MSYISTTNTKQCALLCSGLIKCPENFSIDFCSMKAGLDTSLNTSTNKFSSSFVENSSTKSSFDDRVSAQLRAACPLSKRTPGKNQRQPGGDRFVPEVNTEYAKSLMSASMSQDDVSSTDHVNSGSPGNADGQRLFKSLVDESLQASQQRILHYTKAPEPSQDPLFQNRFRVLFEPVGRPAVTSAATSKRVIPKRSEKTLDAPGLMDDFYLNVVDWSSLDVLAVALSNQLYLYENTRSEIHLLNELPDPSAYFASTRFNRDGVYLAAGTSNAEIMLFDVAKQKCVRMMTGQSSRVSSLAWNSYILTSGSRSGHIHQHDVRVREHLVRQLSHHDQDVCGLEWSPDCRYLASGSNDNLVCIWPAADAASGAASSGLATGKLLTCSSQPLFEFTQHQAAVKALAWCPWQSSLLATGSGTGDRKIRFFSASSGECLKDLDAGSQVSGIVWSDEYREIISAHGPPGNQLVLWKYPKMTKLAELTGHKGRILKLVGSTDGQWVLTAAADETIKMWRVFPPDLEKSKAKESESYSSLLDGACYR